MWDERYAVSEYVYGKEANDFLRDHVRRLKKGRVLSLGSGEGRNEVFLAGQGFQVTALDASGIGLAKAKKLAVEKGTALTTLHTDLAGYAFAEQSWDSIISIFCHLPPALRKTVHQGIIKGLKPGGVFLLEAYTPLQLQYGTGGPSVKEMLLTLKQLQQDFKGFYILYGEEKVRPVREGKYHNGQAAVVQFVARKS